MKASDLVERLLDLMNEHGDLKIKISIDYGEFEIGVANVRFDEGGEKAIFVH